jgi:hypothetical protein
MMSTPQLVAGLLKTGGKLLIVGGGTGELPDPIANHPQILIWDDHDMAIGNREVPSNVKVIMYNRWVSHQTARKLGAAANSLRAIKFPMLKTREIKELLSEFLQTEPIAAPLQELERETERFIASTVEVTEEVPHEVAELKEETVVKSSGRVEQGALKGFLEKNFDNTQSYKARGAISKEAKRLTVIAKKEGIESSFASIAQAVGKLARNKKPLPTTRPTSQLARGNNDDFEQLDVLISDAIAAMKLVQEHLPKVRKETERLRGMKDRVLKLFAE